MSGQYDERYDVYKLTERRARKIHKCDACGEAILSGHRYCVVSWVFQGTAESIKRCARCERIHAHLRVLCLHESNDMWPDEELNCGLDYVEEWGTMPDEIQALAFATPAELQQSFEVEV